MFFVRCRGFGRKLLKYAPDLSTSLVKELPGLVFKSGHSIGFRKIEHLLGDEGKNELLGDGGDAREYHFAQQPLHMILLRIAKAAMRQHGITITSTATIVVVDAVNLTIPFTVPASGQVLVRATMPVQAGTAYYGYMGLMDHTSGLQVGDTQIIGQNITWVAPVTCSWLITGLTPAAALQYDLGAINPGGVGRRCTSHSRVPRACREPPTVASGPWKSSQRKEKRAEPHAEPHPRPHHPGGDRGHGRPRRHRDHLRRPRRDHHRRGGRRLRGGWGGIVGRVLAGAVLDNRDRSRFFRVQIEWRDDHVDLDGHDPEHPTEHSRLAGTGKRR